MPGQTFAPGTSSREERPCEARCQGALRAHLGETVAAACELLGITDATHFKGRRAFGRMMLHHHTRLKALEQTFARLRQSLRDAEPNKAILQKAGKETLRARRAAGLRSGNASKHFRR
jgi:hypothetical protein